VKIHDARAKHAAFAQDGVRDEELTSALQPIQQRWPGYTAKRSPRWLKPGTSGDRTEASEALRGLIDAIVLTPTANFESS